ncbi:Omp28-related outer membrane protein [Candidatus Fermentibacteria bacterium]|nr:Omp28-related outer membrane protein [Candidatus Fermentibacteria bacterium]
MHRRLLLALPLLVICTSFAWASPRRIVLLEEATNASCAPCAQNNPKLQEFFSTHFGGVVSVRYHAWWPGANDPMYLENTVDNRDRIGYYGISGVPNYVMDGTNYGVPGDPDAMVSQMWERLNVPPPVKIVVERIAGRDSLLCNVTVIGDEAIAGNLFLRTAVIERLIVYPTPPGNNGETEFADVMRKMLPDATGIPVASIAAGDTLRFSLGCEIGASWNPADLAVVAWLQDDATKEVFQAGIDLPTYIVETSDPVADWLEPNQSYSKHYWIGNDNPTPLNIQVSLELLGLVPGWSCELIMDSVAHDTLDLILPPGDSAAFDLAIQTGDMPGSVKTKLFGRNLDDAYGYGFSQGYVGVVRSGDILFVDDDGGEAFETLYYGFFDSAGVAFTSITEPDLLPLASGVDTTLFKSIFWNVSWGFPAFVPEDIALLAGYLDGGGNLYLAGQDIGWDIFDPSGNSYFPEAQAFYTTYLDARYLNDNSGVNSMEGVPGDPITDGLAFNVTTVYSRYPEWVESYSGSSIPILMYTNSTKIGALRYDNGTYKTVYLGVGLEQMSDQSAAEAIILRTLEWFADSVVSGDHSIGLPHSLGLWSCEPNPFSTETTIKYDVPRAGDVRLAVHDLLGREVRVVVDAQHEPGTFAARWNGRDGQGTPVAAGVYVCTLQADGDRHSRMVVRIR